MDERACCMLHPGCTVLRVASGAQRLHAASWLHSGLRGCIVLRQNDERFKVDRIIDTVRTPKQREPEYMKLIKVVGSTN